MLRTYDDWKSSGPEGCAFMCECCGKLLGRPGPCSSACGRMLVEERRAEERETERDIVERYLGST
jgi:hypothetical protein